MSGTGGRRPGTHGGSPPRDARTGICSHRGSSLKAAPGRPNPLSAPGLRRRPHVRGTVATRLGPPATAEPAPPGRGGFILLPPQRRCGGHAAGQSPRAPACHRVRVGISPDFHACWDRLLPLTPPNWGLLEAVGTPSPVVGTGTAPPGCRAGCSPQVLPAAQERAPGGCRLAPARWDPKTPQHGETEAGAGAVPSHWCRHEGGGIFSPARDCRPRCTFLCWRRGARHGPRRFPRATAWHAGRGEGGQAGGAGSGSRPSGAGGEPARWSHIREGGSPFPSVFQDPSSPGSGEGRCRLQPSCHGSARLRPSLPAPTGTAGAQRAQAGCWHPCPQHRSAAGDLALRGSPCHSRVTPHRGSRDVMPGQDWSPRWRCRTPGTRQHRPHRAAKAS